MKRSLFLGLILSSIWLCSCERLDIICEHIDYAVFRIDMDWSACPDLDVDGSTVLFYPENGGDPEIVYISGTSEMVSLHPGKYSVVAMNLSFDEYSTTQFSGTDSYSTLEAYGKHAVGTLADNAQKMYAPEQVASASLGDFVVTDDMVEETRISFIKNKYKKDSIAVHYLDIQPRFLVARTHINAYVNGLYNARPDQARGVLRGLSVGVLMATRQYNSSKSASYLAFTPVYNEGYSVNGYIYSNVNTFGICNDVFLSDSVPSILYDKRHKTFSSDIPVKSYSDFPDGTLFLDLTFVLKDKNQTTLNYSFDVSKHCVVKVGVGIDIYVNINTLLDPIVLPDVEFEDGTWGFDAEVVDWGDEEETEVPI